MNDPFAAHAASLTGPALGAMAVTPSDTADLASAIRALTIGTAGGSVSFLSSRDGSVYTTGPLPVGTYSLCASRILASGTTASGLTGWI